MPATSASGVTEKSGQEHFIAKLSRTVGNVWDTERILRPFDLKETWRKPLSTGGWQVQLRSGPKAEIDGKPLDGKAHVLIELTRAYPYAPQAKAAISVSSADSISTAEEIGAMIANKIQEAFGPAGGPPVDREED